MDIKTSGDLKGILDVLSRMEESERAIADFYRICGDTWTSERNSGQVLKVKKINTFNILKE